MKKESWHEFRLRHPAIADKILLLGTALYERGAEAARSSREIKELSSLINEAPQGVRTMLGFPEHRVSETTLLTAIFVSGSSLLLDYVRFGSC